MNLILLDEADRLDGDLFVLDGARAAHIAQVLRAVAGQQVRVGLLNGPSGTGSVVSITPTRAKLTCVFDPLPQPRPKLDLVLGVCRPKSMQKLLPEVAAFGVDRLVLLRTWRVAKPFLSTRILERSVYLPLLHEGMMQGRWTQEPRVQFEPLFKPFVEDRVPSMFAHATVRMVAHPAADCSIAEVHITEEDHVAVVIGPEGGLIPYEVDAFEQAGFQPVRIGPAPLRVETACVAVLAQIELLREIGRQRCNG